MRFLLIAQELHTLPYVIEMDSEAMDVAVTSLTEMKEGKLGLNPMILIDLESGEAKRLVRKDNTEGWMLSDTAFDQLGVATPDEYFAETGTMDVCD